MSKMICVAAVALVLAGCASAPPHVATTGASARLAHPARFDLRVFEPGSEQEAAAARVVEERLTTQGWIRDVERPEVLVEIAYEAAPANLGVHEGDTRPKEPQGWRESPKPRRWWRRMGERRTLSVRLVDPSTGRTVAASTATERSGARVQSPVSDLADALVAAWSEGATDDAMSSQAAGNSMPNRAPASSAS